MRVQVRELVIGAVLAAMALVIPLAFGFLRIVIPPFSATLASHVPVFVAMVISPFVAGVVGLGSTIGFLLFMSPVIAARASVHILFGVVGALLYRSGMRATHAMLVTLPIHALGEALIVVPFGFTLWPAVVVGVGTVPHHLMDVGITVVLLALLKAAGTVREIRI